MKPEVFKRKYEEYLSTKERFNLTEVSHYLQRSPRTIHYLVAKKGLPKHGGKGSGSNGVYVRKEIDKWVRDNKDYYFR